MIENLGKIFKKIESEARYGYYGKYPNIPPVAIPIELINDSYDIVLITNPNLRIRATKFGNRYVRLSTSWGEEIHEICFFTNYYQIEKR